MNITIDKESLMYVTLTFTEAEGDSLIEEDIDKEVKKATLFLADSDYIIDEDSEVWYNNGSKVVVEQVWILKD